jgi:hypothetical protein
VVLALWLPALERLTGLSGRDQRSFGASVLATLLVVLLPPLNGLLVRLPVEIALTVPTAAR